MLISIRHVTEYDYAAPVLGVVQYLRQAPRSGPSQTVNRWQVRCSGASLNEWIDQYGNICHTLVVTKKTEAIKLEVSGQVKTFDTNGVLPFGMTALSSSVFLRETSYTAADGRLRKFARKFAKSVAKDTLAGLHEIMLAIFETVTFAEGETHVHTTASEALAEKRGVCQDHAHIFISVCRELGIPARYVSGYLGSAGGKEEHGASHAWAEAYVEDLGWVSFDAANGVSANEHYVRTAVGLDYSEAAPVRGIRTGGFDEKMNVLIELHSEP